MSKHICVYVCVVFVVSRMFRRRRTNRKTESAEGGMQSFGPENAASLTAKMMDYVRFGK